MPDLIQYALTTIPPEVTASTATASSLAEIDLNLTLLQQLSKITVSLTIGAGPSDLVPDQDTARSIAPQVGVDDDAWQASAPDIASDRYTVTLTPTQGKAATERLRLTLAKVRLNNTEGSASIEVTAFHGETQQKVARPVVKEKPGFFFDDLAPAAGRVAYNTPARLSWKARDIDTSQGFTLKWDKELMCLGADARRAVVPHLRKPTTFVLTAVDKSTGTSHSRETTVEVLSSDGTFTDLTITGKLTVPTVSTTPVHHYVLDPTQKPLVFPAPADGYYTISFATHYRVLRLLPVLTDPGVTGPHDVQITLTNGAITHTFVRRTTGGAHATKPTGQDTASAGKPVTFFAPAGSTLTLTAQDTKVAQLWRSAALVLDVTWKGGNSDRALPPQDFDSALAAALPPAEFPTVQRRLRPDCFAVLSGRDEITEIDMKTTATHAVQGLKHFFYGVDSQDLDEQNFPSNEVYGLFVGGEEGAWNVRTGYPDDLVKRSAFVYLYSALDTRTDEHPKYSFREIYAAALKDGQLELHDWLDTDHSYTPDYPPFPVHPFNPATSRAEVAAAYRDVYSVVYWRDRDGCHMAKVVAGKVSKKVSDARSIQFFHIIDERSVAVGEADGTVSRDLQLKPGWDWKKLGRGVFIEDFWAAEDKRCYVTPNAVYGVGGHNINWPVTPLHGGVKNSTVIDGDGIKGPDVPSLLSRKVLE
ncbi:hypothetical protein [Kitasatospora sp. NPDC008115]|uniref:hypothetical protein n=1 Tax=Kitasatospora sp. NPDC008115 TaxID=3364022 RepID=UPI0036E1D67D